MPSEFTRLCVPFDNHDSESATNAVSSFLESARTAYVKKTLTCLFCFLCIMKQLPFQLPLPYIEALQEKRQALTALRETLRRPEIQPEPRAQFTQWIESQFTVGDGKVYLLFSAFVRGALFFAFLSFDLFYVFIVSLYFSFPSTKVASIAAFLYFPSISPACPFFSCCVFLGLSPSLHLHPQGGCGPNLPCLLCSL